MGAIPLMRIKDLEPIDKYNIYKVTVYPKSEKSKHRTYCSPECRVSIDNYLAWRKRWGDKLHEDEPLFRQDFDTSSFTPASLPGAELSNHRKEIKPIKVNTVRWAINNISSCKNSKGHCLVPHSQKHYY